MTTISNLRSLQRDRKLNKLVEGVWSIALGAAAGAIVELLGGGTVGDILLLLGIGFSRFRNWLLAPGRDGVLHIDKLINSAKNGMDFLNYAIDVWDLAEMLQEKIREAKEALKRAVTGRKK